MSYADDTTQAPKIAELWYNTSTYGYSGFVYFVYTTEKTNYTIYVNVYSTDSLFIGTCTAAFV